MSIDFRAPASLLGDLYIFFSSWCWKQGCFQLDETIIKYKPEGAFLWAPAPELGPLHLAFTPRISRTPAYSKFKTCPDLTLMNVITINPNSNYGPNFFSFKSIFFTSFLLNFSYEAGFGFGFPFLGVILFICFLWGQDSSLEMWNIHSYYIYCVYTYTHAHMFHICRRFLLCPKK